MIHDARKIGSTLRYTNLQFLFKKYKETKTKARRQYP